MGLTFADLTDLPTVILAELTAANAWPPGQLVSVSDQGYALYISNGSSWAEAAAGQYPIVSFLDQGGVGNGVTNDITAMQDAIDEAEDRGGGIAFIDPGHTWRFQSQLILKSGVMLVGGGPTSVLKGVFSTSTNGIVNQTVAGNTNIVLKDFKLDRTGANYDHGIIIRNCVGVDIHGVTVYGSRAFADGVTAGVSGAINVGGFGTPLATDTCYDVRVSRVHIEEADNFGIQFGAVIGGLIANCTAKNCYREIFAVEPGTGLASERVVISNCEAKVGGTKSNSSTATGAVIVTEASGGTVRGVSISNVQIRNETTIASNVSPGFNVQGGTGVTLMGIEARGCNGPGLVVGAAGVTTTKVQITGVIVDDCNKGGNSTPDGAGIKIRNATHCQIKGAIVEGASHTHSVEETSSSANNVISGEFKDATPFGTPGTGSVYADFKTTDSDASFHAGTGLAVGMNTLSNPALSINGAAATQRQLKLQTAGLDRWHLRANGTAEGGANAGSDLELLRRADDGTNAGTVLTVTRSSGDITFGSGVDLVTAGAFIEGTEIADPAAPAANGGRLYFKDVGGKTALMARFPTGAVQQIAIEP